MVEAGDGGRRMTEVAEQDDEGQSKITSVTVATSVIKSPPSPLPRNSTAQHRGASHFKAFGNFRRNKNLQIPRI